MWPQGGSSDNCCRTMSGVFVTATPSTWPGRWLQPRRKETSCCGADRLGQLSRYEPEQGPFEDPIAFVRFVLANAFIHGTASSQLQRFFVNVPDEIDEAFDSGMPSWIDALRKAFLDENLPPDRIADIVTDFDFTAAEGGANCHRVAVTSKSVTAFSWTATILRGEQGLRLYRPGHQQSEIGREALNLLAKGREDDAGV